MGNINWDRDKLGDQPTTLEEMVAEIAAWRSAAAILGSKEEAWLSEECWRTAVRNIGGKDLYASVQTEAAALRSKYIPPGGRR